MSRLHMLAPNQTGDGREGGRRTLCGQRDLGDVGLARYATTQDAGDVTCRVCARKMRQRGAGRAVLDVAAAVWAGHQPHQSRGDVDALRRSLSGEPEETGPRWRSVAGALEHEARVVLDGAPVRSSSDPDRYGVLPQRSLGALPTPAAIAGREDVISVRQSIARATRACAEAVAVGAIGVGAPLDAADLEIVLRWSLQGEPVWQRTAPARKGGVWRLVARTAQDIADALTRRHARTVTERQVTIAKRAVVRAFAASLREMGELAAARPREPAAPRERQPWDPTRRLREARSA